MSDEFRTLVQEFVRRFGLLSADTTPCGKPFASSDAHALMLLLDAGEAGLLSSALGAQLGIDKSTASRVTARLGERELLEPAPADDARARPIRLTRKGVRLAREVQESSRARFADVLARVPARRRTHVVAALRDLVAALDPPPGDDNP
ncbi:MAG: MarR family winged helix-turn-helix transcriptional regulator [Kofleriaceae bacterium]